MHWYPGTFVIAGCGNSQGANSAPEANSTNAVESTENNGVSVKQEEYLSRTFIDGITFAIPEDWEEFEIRNDSDIIPGICYFLEVDGELEKDMYSMIGYSTDNVNEGLDMIYSVNPADADLSADEMITEIEKIAAESNDSENEATYEMIDINGRKVIKGQSAQIPEQTVYYLCIGNGRTLIIDAYSKPSAATHHAAVIENVINSITIDEKYLK